MTTAIRMTALLYLLIGYGGALAYLLAWQFTDVWRLIRGRKRDVSLRATLRLFCNAAVLFTAWPLVLYWHRPRSRAHTGD